MSPAEVREGVSLTNLDQPLFPDAGATKRDLLDYLDAVSARLLPVLADRPLSVVRVLRGQDEFMQKNLPKYTPGWVPRVKLWAETSKRDISYALCNDRRTLLWFGNQRAIEYHPTLTRVGHEGPTHLILDLDPPEGAAFGTAVAGARLVRRALADAGLAGALKTSGAKGVHVFVPLAPGQAVEDVAAATRAVAARAERLDPDRATTAFIREDRHGKVFLDSTRAGGATVVAAYSPRVRPGVRVSFPVPWSDADDVTPADFTVHTALKLLGGEDSWVAEMPAPQELPADLVEEGHTIPVARVAAMHEGKRRARARRESGEGG
ncbi:ATP-dependent DNA ligase [Amycolatopsis sp. PS_44_ISF1]|uniref:DNA polymerase domain-containing protein n=1 Tax=Amycolatopsis sp. PS_44_ISF1 TaxID=2974917 RepID=UPI0028DE4131|nr:ATP-dependent DNA ligase [Amycolatopsis sp. PS_44_ISF1]MDT8911256.1 ATP-dependent DNA ligase [Amycolatopsis sp. PS_44_ISF1]